MVTIWRCPGCAQPAQVPAELEAGVSLRCPHCQAVFSGDQATPCDEVPADVTSAFECVASQPEATPTPQQAEEPPAPAGLDLVVRCPHCLAEAALHELTVAATGEPLDATLLEETLHHASNSEEHAPHESPLALGPQVAAPATSTAAWTRQAGSPKSFLGQLFGILLGGLLAIPLAYYILNAVGGESFDWLPVPLPGVTHTYKHLPPWWPNWARPHAAPQPPADGAMPEQPEKQP